MPLSGLWFAFFNLMYLTVLSNFTFFLVIIYIFIYAVQQTADSKEMLIFYSSERYTDISLYGNYHYFLFENQKKKLFFSRNDNVW